MDSGGSGSTWSFERSQFSSDAEIGCAEASSGFTFRRGFTGMSDESWEKFLRRQEKFLRGSTRLYSLNYTYGRRARDRAALLDFPGHQTGYARPAGFGSTAGGGSRFLFFVCWLWLLIKNLHPTNWPGDLQAGGSGSTISFPSSPLNGIMSAEASSGFAVGRYALGAELNHMLASPGFTVGGGSQPVFVDAMGGRYLVININAPQQGDQGVAAATQDGKGDRAQRALQSVFGGLVPLCCTLLLDDNILNGASHGYIKAATCVGLGLVTLFTYLGLASKKKAMAAARVVASTAMASVNCPCVYTFRKCVHPVHLRDHRGRRHRGYHGHRLVIDYTHPDSSS